MLSRDSWLYIIATVSGVALVVITFFEAYFFDSWLISIPVFLSLAILFLTLSITGMWKRQSYYVQLFIIVSLLVLAGNLYDQELFKSPRILKANLNDDLSRLTLVLRQNNTFELSAQDLFSKQVYSGKYVRNRDQIIFLNRPYDNDFIPDTVYKVNDKIILSFIDGIRDTSFASYFQIEPLQ